MPSVNKHFLMIRYLFQRNSYITYSRLLRSPCDAYIKFSLLFLGSSSKSPTDFHPHLKL